MSEASPYSALADSLRERRRLIADREFFQRDAAGHLTALQAVSEAIEQRAKILPAPVDANLAHYLSRCSYDKALSWLEARA